jgi:membrane dipeptidase
LLFMHFIIDAHCDLAWTLLSFGRDYWRSAEETREAERGGPVIEANGDTLLGWADYQRGHVEIVFSTLFAAPARSRMGDWDTLCYSTPAEAHALCRQQLSLYQELAESSPDKFQLICDKQELRTHIGQWQAGPGKERPVGLVALMEGADAILSVDELAEWHELGLRIIGLAWSGTRYAGGTREPGPLSADARPLLKGMAELGFVLDLSHMDEQASFEAIDFYDGPIIATHVNCLALLPNFPTNRHFSDRLLRALLERGGIIGSVPANQFLKPEWSRRNGSRRDEVPLDVYAAHIDHVCQLAGNSTHAGIGSDFDGGFGLQSTPPEIDTIADLQKLVPLLKARGYGDADAANILGMNWQRFLDTNLPE